MSSPRAVIVELDTEFPRTLQVKIRRRRWRPFLSKQSHRSSASFLDAVLYTIFEKQSKIEAESLWSFTRVRSSQHRRITVMCEVGNTLRWISLLELFIFCLEAIDRTSLAINPMAIKFICLA
jgi:hypothetical protein